MRSPHLVSTAVRIGALLGCRTSRVQGFVGGGGSSGTGTHSTAAAKGLLKMTNTATSTEPVGAYTGPALRTYVDGNARGPVLVFIHGWPDDHTMWDKQVAHLKDRYLCVTTDLPGFNGKDAGVSRWGYSPDDVVTRLERTIEAAGNGQPVTLVAHDWGCMFSFMVEKKRPDLVRRMVILDIGGAFDVSLRTYFLITSYHLWLIVAFLVGGPIGDAMSRGFARLSSAPLGPRVANAHVCYPYYQWWKRRFSKNQESVKPMIPTVPILFLYGSAGYKNILPFHADWWAEEVEKKEGSAVFAMTKSAHWVAHDEPDEVNRRIDAFLAL